MKKRKILHIISILVLSGILIGALNVVACICNNCRWTGGGTIGYYNDQRVTHGFELHCSIDLVPNNLEVNWGGNHFHLMELTFVECWLDQDPAPPHAPCSWISGEGTGRYNNVDGYNIAFVFSDAGEPGKDNDWGTITITAPGTSEIILEVEGFLHCGNHQAHRLTGHDL